MIACCLKQICSRLAGQYALQIEDANVHALHLKVVWRSARLAVVEILRQFTNVQPDVNPVGLQCVDVAGDLANQRQAV